MDAYGSTVFSDFTRFVTAPKLHFLFKKKEKLSLSRTGNRLFIIQRPAYSIFQARYLELNLLSDVLYIIFSEHSDFRF